MIAKKRKTEKPYQAIFFSFAFILFILVIVGFLGLSNWKISQQRADLNNRIKNLKEDITTLENRKKELEASASKSEKEEYLEKVAREQFNLKKPGEEVVTVLAPEQEEKKENPKEEKNFWQKLLEKIGF